VAREGEGRRGGEHRQARHDGGDGAKWQRDGSGRRGGGGVKGRLGHSVRGRMMPIKLVSALMARRWSRRWPAANAPVAWSRARGRRG
jgi:hypothetical protein